MTTGNRFFALYPPAEVCDELASIARRHVKTGRPTARQRLHMTLAFLGERSGAEIDAAQAVAGGLSCPPFELRLDRPGYFYRQRIFWLGASSPPPALPHLANALRQGLWQALTGPEGGPDPLLAGAPPFVPHVTLARRVAPGWPPTVEPVHWQVGRFALMHSAPEKGGHVYRVLDEWRLTGG